MVRTGIKRAASYTWDLLSFQHCAMARRLLYHILRFVFGRFTTIEADGMQNIPESGGCILAVNHLSRLDPALVYIFIERQDLNALVAKKYHKFPPTRWLVNLLNGIWIDRGQPDLGALRAARKYLRSGGILGISPEGARSHTRSLISGKSGVAYLASKADVPIIPVGIMGTEKAAQAFLRLRRPQMTIRFGAPFRLPPINPEDREGSLSQNTDEIMCQIAALLNPAYRGVYADHPRLSELLQREKELSK